LFSQRLVKERLNNFLKLFSPIEFKRKKGNKSLF
jgi:hypothetical protein